MDAPKAMDQPALVDAAWERYNLALERGGSSNAGMLAVLAPLLEENARLREQMRIMRADARAGENGMRYNVDGSMIWPE